MLDSQAAVELPKISSYINYMFFRLYSNGLNLGKLCELQHLPPSLLKRNGCRNLSKLGGQSRGTGLHLVSKNHSSFMFVPI